MTGRIDGPFPAPAKINRFLRITRRRDDGYHELQTVFQFLELADQLHFERLDGPGLELAVTGAGEVGPFEQNLCVRAVRALEDTVGFRLGLRIRLDKRIPVGGGLGGGSSDAATTLIVVNRIFGLGLDRESLLALALKLGADVPVFVAGHASWAEGVGERLTALAPDAPVALVIDPGVRVGTAELFADPALTRDCQPLRIGAQDFHALGNVFEPLVRSHHPRIEWLFRELEAKGVSPRLSGSGGCVFALFRDGDGAAGLLESLASTWRGWVTPVRNRSPLHALLGLV